MVFEEVEADLLGTHPLLVLEVLHPEKAVMVNQIFKYILKAIKTLTFQNYVTIVKTKTWGIKLREDLNIDKRLFFFFANCK